MFKILVVFLSLSIFGCYSFSGTNISPDVKTLQINPFPNYSKLNNPNLSQQFTVETQDFFQSRTPLSIVKEEGHLIISGEIRSYRVTATASGANDQAQQNRLTIGVKVRYINTKNEKDNFEKAYSEYEDFDRNQLLTGDFEEQIVSTITERIAQKIFNDTVGNW